MRWRWFPALAGVVACTAGLPPRGGSAPYVDAYPEKIAVSMPARAPTITQQFRAADTLSARGQDWTEHLGLDVHAPVGTPVIAAAAGRVEQSYYDPGYGNVVVISHGGQPAYWTRYVHLDFSQVSAGAQVARGARIGALGTTGALSGGFPHVHFELWEKQPGGLRTAIDPHLKWADGVGRVTCFDGRASGGAFKLTYPVPCG